MSRKIALLVLLSAAVSGCGDANSSREDGVRITAVPGHIGGQVHGTVDFAHALPPQVLPEQTCRAALLGSDRTDCHKEWTLLVYMAADNDLTPYALWDLYEMEAGYKSGRKAAGSTLKSDVLVQLDTEGTTDGIRRLHMVQRLEPLDASLGIDHFRAMKAGDISSPVVERVEEESAPSHEQRFREFIEWGMRAYPSKHYMVVVWGHGQGFNGIGFDDSDGGKLTIPSLRRALGSISEEVLGGKPIDVYAADSCLMQQLEVAYEISGSVNYIVGSTQVQNYLGLPYRRILYELNTGTFAGFRAKYPSSEEPELVARMIPKLFRASFNVGGLQSRHSPEAIREVTMSALSASELEHQFVPALGTFAVSLDAYLTEDPYRSVAVQYLVENAPKFLGGAQDLGIFLGLLKSHLREDQDPSAASRKLLRSIDALKDALERTVLAYAHGTRFEDPQDPFFLPGWFRAVSLWLPTRASEYEVRITDFRSSALYQRLPQWDRWLNYFYAVR